MAWQFPQLTRRAFLQASATTAGAGLLGAPAIRTALGKGERGSELPESTYYTICNFCTSLCNVQVTTRGEGSRKRIVKLDGNPHSTLNRGHICARGQAGLYQTYDTDRLKEPLIRVEGTKRGERKFRKATWEEAWSYIAKRAKEAEIQPWEWTAVGGWTSCIFYMDWSVSFAMGNEVPNLVASPMQHCVLTGHLGTNAVTGNFNVHDEILPDFDNAAYVLLLLNNASIGAVSTCRMVRFAEGIRNNAKVVALDTRLSETAAKADEWIQVRPGTDLDFALGMIREMMREGYYDGEFLRQHTNMPFLARRSEGNEAPSLVRDGQGRPYCVDERTGEVRTLAAFSHHNRADIDGQPVRAALTVPEDLEVDGQPVETVFQAQLRAIDECTPEWVAERTGVSAETVRHVARDFGTTRPAVVDPGWHGARYGNIQMLRRAQAILQTLVGGVDKRGGWLMGGEYRHKAVNTVHAQQRGESQKAPLASMAGMPFFHFVGQALSKGENFSHGRPGWSWAWAKQQKAKGEDWVRLPAMADTGLRETVEGKLEWNGEPYRVRGIFMNAANPVHHYYPAGNWKEILSSDNVELVVVTDVLPSDTTAYADVILPNSTYLERSEPKLYGNGVNPDLGVTTRYAAIDPLYDTREIPDILYRLSEIISGSADGFLKALEKLVGVPEKPLRKALEKHRKAGAKSPFAAACRDVTFELAGKAHGMSGKELDATLREEGVHYRARVDELIAEHGMPHHVPVPTASGRLEVFSQFFEGLWGAGGQEPNFHPLAVPVPARCRPEEERDQPLGEDEFYFTYGKVPTVSHGSTNANNPILAAINRFKSDIYTGIWIHPDRAEGLGIGHGDPIRITNTQSGQEATGTAYVTRKVRKDTMFMYSAFGTETAALTRAGGVGTATGHLIPYQVGPVVGGFRSQEFTVRIAKA
mgnify:CR=1 FL=1